MPKLSINSNFTTHIPEPLILMGACRTAAGISLFTTKVTGRKRDEI